MGSNGRRSKFATTGRSWHPRIVIEVKSVQLASSSSFDVMLSQALDRNSFGWRDAMVVTVLGSMG